MLHLEGEKAFPLPPPALWTRLSDLRFLAECVPDVHQIKEAGDRSAALVIRPGFSFARGELQLTMEKVDETDPHSARLRLKTRGIGTTSELMASFQIAEQAGGSLVRWSAEVQHLGGLLKAVPQGLIQAAAQRVLGDLLANIEKHLAE